MWLKATLAGLYSVFAASYELLVSSELTEGNLLLDYPFYMDDQD